MDRIAQFQEALQSAMTATLATAADGRVTMRTVSPVAYQGGILIFTARSSLKFYQMETCPGCCVSVGPFFAEAKATPLGPTMLDENEPLREAYSAKFPGAFDEGLAFGGRAAEFVLLKPFRLSGWAFEDGAPNPEGIPTVPFDIDLNADAAR